MTGGDFSGASPRPFMHLCGCTYLGYSRSLLGRSLGCASCFRGIHREALRGDGTQRANDLSNKAQYHPSRHSCFVISLSLTLTLKTWKMLEPTTTNKKNARMHGPTEYPLSLFSTLPRGTFQRFRDEGMKARTNRARMRKRRLGEGG